MAGKADGSVIIDTRMNTSGFQTGVANMKKGFGGLSSALGKIGKLMLVAFSVKQLVQFGKEAIELGSDLSEVQNVVDVTFENLSGEINEFASNAIEQFGLSETAAKQYTSTIGAMLKSMGFTTREAADMGKTITGLAADMASFYNLDSEEAFYKIRAGISGETEPLKQLGINMSVANLEQYALTQGITKSYNAMTQQEQALLRYNYLLSVTADAQGDFARTSDSWANQTRILSEQFKALKATIGQGLINIFLPVVKVINTLLAKLATLANAFKAFTELITGKKSSAGTGGMSTGLASNDMSEGYDSAAEGAENYANATDEAADATQKAEKAAKGYLSPLDEINKLQNESEDFPDVLASPSGNANGTEEIQSVGYDVDFGSLAEGETVIEKVSDKLLKLKEILTGLFKPFKDAWALQGQSTIDAAKTALSSIGALAQSVGKSFYDVWTNGTGVNILTTILQIVQNILLSVGNLAMRFMQAWNTAGVGTAIIQGIANAIQIILDFINRIAVATAQWAANINFYPLLESIKILIESFLPVLQSLGNVFSDIYQNIILPIFTYLIETALPNILNVVSTLFNFISEHQWIVEAIGAALVAAFSATKIVALISKIVKAIKTLILIFTGTGGIALAIAAVIAAGILLYQNWDKIKEAAEKLWNTTLKPFADFIKGIFLQAWEMYLRPALEYLYRTVLPELIKTFKNLWNNVLVPFGTFLSSVLKPIFDILITVLKELWTNVVIPLADVLKTTFKNAFQTVSKILNDTVIPAVRTVINILQKLWENILVPVGDFIKNTFGPAFTAVFGNIHDIIIDFGRTLNNIIDLIQNVFAGNWQMAWEKIKMIFLNVFTGLSDIARTPINAIIGAFNGIIQVVNGMISKINSINFRIDIPNWIPVIGGSWWQFGGFSIPTLGTIPYLAQGAVIPPNAPFAAVLGDQKHGTNVETPVATIEEAVDKAVRNAMQNQGAGGTIHVHVDLNGREIAETVLTEFELKRIRSGRQVFGGA